MDWTGWAQVALAAGSAVFVAGRAEGIQAGVRRLVEGHGVRLREHDEHLAAHDLAIAATAGAQIRALTPQLGGVVQGAGVAVQDLDTAVRQAEPAEQAAARTVTDFDELIRSPQIPATLISVQHVATNLDATTSDFQQKFHLFLYPAPCHTLGCKLRRTWPYIKGAYAFTGNQTNSTGYTNILLAVKSLTP